MDQHEHTVTVGGREINVLRKLGVKGVGEREDSYNSETLTTHQTLNGPV